MVEPISSKMVLSEGTESSKYPKWLFQILEKLPAPMVPLISELESSK